MFVQKLTDRQHSVLYKTKAKQLTKSTEINTDNDKKCRKRMEMLSKSATAA